MPSCRDMTALATSYLEGVLPPPEREAFERHLEGCDGCHAFLDQLRATVRLASRLPAPEVAPAQRAALLSTFDAWRAGQAGGAAAPAPSKERVRRSGRAVAVGLVLAVPALLLAMARHPTHQPVDLLAGAALLAVAGLLAALAGRLTHRRAAAAAAVALAVAFLRGGAGAHDLHQGLDCLLTIVGAAGGLAGLAWVAAARGLAARAGTWAVAGALAADAALQVTCQAHVARAHLLLFHAGAVGVVALVAAAWTARHAEPA